MFRMHAAMTPTVNLKRRKSWGRIPVSVLQAPSRTFRGSEEHGAGSGGFARAG